MGVQVPSPALRLLALLCLVAGVGCSAAIPHSQAPSETLNAQRTTNLELELSRASLFQTEFEQYTIAEDSFFGECGVITRGRQSADQQFLHQVTREEQAKLDTAVAALLASMAEDGSFAKPGKLSGLADPGRLNLHFTVAGERRSISTSLDSIVNGDTQQERAVRSLVEHIRNFGERKTRCGFEGFFGLR